MTPRGADLQQLLRARLRGFEVRTLDRDGRRHAAVAVAVTEQGHGADLPGLPQHAQWSDAPALLVTRRAETLHSHAGQWALPGGRIDEGETPEQAALRELAEEECTLCSTISPWLAGWTITPPARAVIRPQAANSHSRP